MTDKQPDALRLADHLERFRSFPDDLEAAAELRRLHAENEALRYEVDAIAAIKEERDGLQASLREAKKLLEAYTQVKAADEARMRHAVRALERMKKYGDVFLCRAHEQKPYDQVCEAIDALKERLE